MASAWPPFAARGADMQQTWIIESSGDIGQPATGPKRTKPVGACDYCDAPARTADALGERCECNGRRGTYVPVNWAECERCDATGRVKGEGGTYRCWECEATGWRVVA